MREAVERLVAQGGRLEPEHALWLYREAHLSDLRRWASAVRGRFHPPHQASYLIMRIINYTNICVARCDYCAFYRLPQDAAGYVLTLPQIFAKIDEMLAVGGDFAGFNGGFHPRLRLSWYQDLFRAIRHRYGNTIEFYGLTVSELMYIAKQERLSVFEAAQALALAGVRWITGGGAEILTNAFRARHSPQKFTADQFMEAQEEIIRAGLNTTATMVIGFDESCEERVEHLLRVRELQDRTSGLFSFLSWTYKPENTALGGQELPAKEYWRHLAVSRLFLDNIRHIRSSVLTQNEAALEGLHYGANDFDIPLEDQVTQLAGGTIEGDVGKVLAACRAAGFEPVYRAMASTHAPVGGLP